MWRFISFSIPPGYQRLKPIYSPKLGEFTGIIDAILAVYRARFSGHSLALSRR